MCVRTCVWGGCRSRRKESKKQDKPAGGAPTADQRAAMMKKFDKDGDGKLSDTEKSAMRASLGGGGGKPNGAGGGGGNRDEKKS